ncbi:hypothetical protein CIHG_07083 [Coccidioides immitis H538.4]|uniref:Uncharacterized protein n=3 Tax=Coccidioides immitis TaxID=5501 RepID=A0A0J8QNR1_COCIT|nr:hypothetical protein CIRG_08596 [Coccidioides immitis RMSCC 2394]KMU74069.1 hypothetical protein CISG_03998 [Coccidioides immitis RMSCC 3703]KMU89151.1 hypothetical protein CIHG_07083 [Coccidioides immitis H538.4]
MPSSESSVDLSNPHWALDNMRSVGGLSINEADLPVRYEVVPMISASHLGWRQMDIKIQDPDKRVLYFMGLQLGTMMRMRPRMLVD